jgi:HPt (histidine-containing phosphotransfer) domain-containing protein
VPPKVDDCGNPGAAIAAVLGRDRGHPPRQMTINQRATRTGVSPRLQSAFYRMFAAMPFIAGKSISSLGRLAVIDPATSPAEPAIDLAHLARMTLGERSLEREVLALFDRQTELLLPRIRTAKRPAAATLAHTMKGSALGIGAWRVARAAEAVELATERELPAAVEVLGAAVAETCNEIARLLRSH